MTTTTQAPRTARVLLADDSPLALAMTSLFLRQDGYIVDTAHDGMDALRVVLIQLPDVVVLDYQMPLLTGLEAAATLLQLHARLPIFILTSFVNDELRWEAERLGVRAVLDKGAGPASLRRAVREALMGSPGLACAS